MRRTHRRRSGSRKQQFQTAQALEDRVMLTVDVEHHEVGLARNVVPTPAVSEYGALSRRIWLLGAVLIAWTAVGPGAAPALAQSDNDLEFFSGAGLGLDPREGIACTYGLALVDGTRREGGVMVVQCNPASSSIALVRTEVHEVAPTYGEGDEFAVVAVGTSEVRYSRLDVVETNVPTTLSLTGDTLSLLLDLSDGVAGINLLVTEGGNSPPEPLPSGSNDLAVVAGAGMGPDGAFAGGAVVIGAAENQGGRKVELDARGRLWAGFTDRNGRDVDVDGALSRGAVKFVRNELAELEVSGPAMVHTPDGDILGECAMNVETTKQHYPASYDSVVSVAAPGVQAKSQLQAFLKSL